MLRLQGHEYCPTLPLFCAPYAIQKCIGSIGRAPNCRILGVSMKIYEGTGGDKGKVMDAKAGKSKVVETAGEFESGCFGLK